MTDNSSSILAYRVASQVAQQNDKKILVITAGAAQSYEVQRQLNFFLKSGNSSGESLEESLEGNLEKNPKENSGETSENNTQQPNESAALLIPDNENLPYDSFSPGKMLASKRIKSIYRMLSGEYQILLIGINTLIRLLAPRSYFLGRGLAIKTGQTLDYQAFSEQLINNGYIKCNFVRQPGEMAVRGAIMDMFPAASPLPYRIELLDDTVVSLRSFSVEEQTSIETVPSINILPSTEYPVSEDARQCFCRSWQRFFSGEARLHPTYKEIKQGLIPQGIESFLPFFFEGSKNTPLDKSPDTPPDKPTGKTLESYFDYLSASITSHQVFYAEDIFNHAQQLIDDAKLRYETLGGESAVLLPPNFLYLSVEQLKDQLKGKQNLYEDSQKKLDASDLPDLRARMESDIKLEKLAKFSKQYEGKILICASSMRRKELLKSWLEQAKINYAVFSDWDSFINSKNTKDTNTVGLMLVDITDGICHTEWAIITENNIFNESIHQSSEVKSSTAAFAPQSQLLIKNIAHIAPGELVVHTEHGVGKFLGLEQITHQDYCSEYISIEYAEQTKLYLPVHNLHLLSRYIGRGERQHSLDKLGSKQWSIRKANAMRKIEDSAASLLELYAKRANRKGITFMPPTNEYEEFSAGFPYAETEDQLKAINDVLKDMLAEKKTDRLVCGDVGFGKTEVAMRAAYIAAASGYQVALLVPTTILAGQHLQTFSNRFANTPFIIKQLTRLSGSKNVKQIKEDIVKGKADIIIGTHALLSKSMAFKNLGLVIIDEEHRFGVRQKEKLKSLREDVDILSLTATPIPRTLNLALSGLRDISLMASPPPGRLPIKTYVGGHSDEIIKEAITRELMRDGQVYYVYNNIAAIQQKADSLGKLFPDVRSAIIHGSMDKWQLEETMHDFYHKKIAILVSTTIIENGLDVPNANTIIIEKAENFGLAQLHQMRGRVGRRKRQAFAYFLISNESGIKSKAAKRIKAVGDSSLPGLGFNLAANDLEIRGAGEILGTEQSGSIQKIGLELYTQMLEKTVLSLQRKQKQKQQKPSTEHKDSNNAFADSARPAGATPNNAPPALTSAPPAPVLPEINSEVDITVSALLPDDYIDDVYERLITYKRMATGNETTLNAIRKELKDKYGELPPYAANLFEIHHIRIMAQQLGITKLTLARTIGKALISKEFTQTINRCRELMEEDPHNYGFKMEGDGAEVKNDSFNGSLHFRCSGTDDAKQLSEVNRILIAIQDSL